MNIIILSVYVVVRQHEPLFIIAHFDRSSNQIWKIPRTQKDASELGANEKSRGEGGSLQMRKIGKIIVLTRSNK